MDDRNRGNEALSSLAGGILEDVQSLVRQEVKLAKAEVSAELTKVKEAGTSLGIGLVLTVLSLVLVSFAAVHLVHSLSNGGVPLWVSYLLIGLFLGGLAAFLLVVGKSKIETVKIVPPKTAETMKDVIDGVRGTI